MVVIDWLQTCEFLRENADRFTLYALCGGLVGIILILLSIIIVLYIQYHFQSMPDDDDDDPPSPLETAYELHRSYLPVYRYNDRLHPDFYHLSS